MDKKSSTSSGNAIAFKVVMIGDSSVGKTCLVNRYTKNKFTPQDPTLGQDFKAVNTKVNHQG